MIGGTSINQSIHFLPHWTKAQSTRIMSLLYLLCLPIIFLASSLTPHPGCDSGVVNIMLNA